MPSDTFKLPPKRIRARITAPFLIHPGAFGEKHIPEQLERLSSNPAGVHCQRLAAFPVQGPL
jgi:hypothetical protein